MSAALDSIRPLCSDAEWQTRVDLAALYRLFVRYGWTDLIYTHISARVPDEENTYLINPYGPLFDEMTASMMLKVNLDGELLDTRGEEYNQAGHMIHSAVLKARPDANFVLHTHTRAGVAVSAMKCGLLPISQHANLIRDAVCYHDYAQVTSDDDECERLGRDLSDKNIMIMRNHGMMTCGRTAGEAFWFMYYIEACCKIQIDVLTSGTEYITPDDSAVSELRKHGLPQDPPRGTREWPALLRSLDKADSSFRQ